MIFFSIIEQTYLKLCGVGLFLLCELYGGFVSPFPSLIQDGVGVPEDAPSGPGGGLLSRAQHSQAVPGALPLTAHCGATEIPQVSVGVGGGLLFRRILYGL